jgi:ankyrin repeat protein
MSAPFAKRILTILTCPIPQAIYKGDSPLSNPEFDIDLCDNKGWTSLYFACEKGYTNIARILLEHHADPHKLNMHGNNGVSQLS